jgi:hypothetical protein
VLDLADALDPASLTRAVHDARVRHLLSLDALATQLKPGRASATLRRLLERPAAPTRSAFEDAFLAFCDRYDLPRPRVNAIVAGYEVDALWPRQRFIADLDGRAQGEIPVERDLEKDADLLTAGHRVIRVTWTRLTERPAKEAALLGGQRPRDVQRGEHPDGAAGLRRHHDDGGGSRARP